MKPFNYPYLPLLCVGLLVMAFTISGYGQGLIVNTLPASANDTVFICLDDRDSISFNASYTPAPDSIEWSFQSGTPSAVNGGGSHWVSYTSPGNFRARVRVYNAGSIDTTYSIRVDVRQIGPVSFQPY
ncbi:MAG: PKD domain-containing protein [Owenweeksia sp.]|nr:PKD domain-containing protein [Owenweeksia sp.]